MTHTFVFISPSASGSLCVLSSPTIPGEGFSRGQSPPFFPLGLKGTNPNHGTCHGKLRTVRASDSGTFRVSECPTVGPHSFTTECGTDSHANVCSSCASSLRSNHIPALSLVKGMWIGDIPFILRLLTLPERILVA